MYHSNLLKFIQSSRYWKNLLTKLTTVTVPQQTTQLSHTFLTLSLSSHSHPGRHYDSAGDVCGDEWSNVKVRSQALFKCTSSHQANDPIQDHTPRFPLIFPCDYPLSPVYHPATWQLGQCFLPGGVKRHPHLHTEAGWPVGATHLMSYLMPVFMTSSYCLHHGHRPRISVVIGLPWSSYWWPWLAMVMTEFGDVVTLALNFRQCHSCTWVHTLSCGRQNGHPLVSSR